MHLVIYFCGTGDLGHLFVNNNYLNNPEVVKIFVRGCETPEAGHLFFGLFPNLNAFAKRFTQKLFTKARDCNQLLINYGDVSDLGSININIWLSSANLTTTKEIGPIKSIILCGYSRGAVTCFEVARELHKLAPNVPVDIVADQPVPGNCYQGLGTNAASVADCRALKNLRNVSIILGAYTGAVYEHDVQEKKRYTNPFHRTFLSQMVPRLPETTCREIIVIPKESHFQSLHGAPNNGEHMHMLIARFLNLQGSNLVSDDLVRKKTDKARDTYKSGYSEDSPVLFPKKTQLQRIFGLNTNNVYRYTDRLHPYGGIRIGYKLNPYESLKKWWDRHDKNTSRFSTQLTDDLVETINQTDENNLDSLKKLFAQADKWLLLKANTFSSRYEQVEALRNNVHHLLTNNRNVNKFDLALINRNNLHSTHYFLKHWTLVSKNASYFKTNATRVLDKAFAEHDKKSISLEADSQLLAFLDDWLTVKSDSKTKRWDEVIEIKTHLMRIIENWDKTARLSQNEINHVRRPNNTPMG